MSTSVPTRGELDLGAPLIQVGDVPVIDSFTGPHRFLSNFAFGSVRWSGRRWRTVEHAFQAAKTLDSVGRAAIYAADSPGQAKRLGRQVTLRPGWEAEKVDVMGSLLARKFADRELGEALVGTGDAYLIEGNAWGDTVWGAVRDPSVDGVPWRGWNLLGRLLMDVRWQLRVEWATAES